ncbi:septation protein SepH [Gordonia sp. CPCC 205515]|uniref:septation protein SepH n=1 Tax=Gordonia sp. CPCC 205515 TaxID=3140791 RepID=UPI003AF39C7F
MRELRVVGVEADGSHVVCRDPESGEKYRIAADERLRAAARGDISRLGQIEIEMESSLRPREIQARIRAGATIAEVAAEAGVTHDKIERFAHPVLLERSRAAELAGMSHPIREDGPAVATLGEVVADAMVALGQAQNEIEWDAWKGDDGHWVVQVSWHVGRTDNHAHWRYMPGSHGGTADPLDDLADELTHPETITPRRRLTPVATPDLAAPPEAAPVGGHEAHDEVTIDANRLIDAQRTRTADTPPTHDEYGTVALDFGTDESSWAAPEPVPDEQRPVVAPEPAAGPEPDIVEPEITEPEPTSGTVTELPSAVEPVESPTSTAEHVDDDDHDDEPTKPRRRKGKPALPAWEDVLLGVRSNGHS